MEQAQFNIRKVWIAPGIVLSIWKIPQRGEATRFATNEKLQKENERIKLASEPEHPKSPLSLPQAGTIAPLKFASRCGYQVVLQTVAAYGE
jgi:hypothetical protein